MEWKNLYSPENYDHYLKVADGIFKSRAVQKTWLANPESILFVMQMGVDMGISPLIALDKIRKMGQNWMLDINLVRSLVAEKGGMFQIINEDPTKGIKTTLTRGDFIHEETVTLEQVKRSGAAGNPNWTKYPKQMFRAAAFRQSCNVLFSDVLHGNRVADFDVESAEDFTDSNEAIDPATVTETDSKPKVSAAEKKAATTRNRRTKKRIELESLVAEKKSVGMSLVETDSDKDLLKEAGYIWIDRSHTYEYSQIEPKQTPPVKEAPPVQQEEEPPPPVDWDLQSAPAKDNAPDFDPAKPDHITLLTAAADTMSWEVDIENKVKSCFLNFIKGKGIKASHESLTKGLTECASQFLK